MMSETMYDIYAEELDKSNGRLERVKCEDEASDMVDELNEDTGNTHYFEEVVIVNEGNKLN